LAQICASPHGLAGHDVSAFTVKWKQPRRFEADEEPL